MLFGSFYSYTRASNKFRYLVKWETISDTKKKETKETVLADVLCNLKYE